MKRLVFLLVILAGACLRAEEFQAGVCTHLRSLDEVPLMARAGVTSFRTDFFWSEIETQKGVFVVPKRYDDYVNAARRAGIEPLLILCYSNQLYDGGDYPRSPAARAAYARFCTFAARHFRGRVRQFEIWNEWNWGTGMNGRPGDAASYVLLLADAYSALKAVDAKLVVLGGATSNTGLRGGWLPDACAAGLLNHLDGLSFHPYCWGAEGAAALPAIGVGERIAAVTACIAAYPRGRTVPLYLTEIGWPSHRGANGSSERQVETNLRETFALAAANPRVRGVWWYALRDDGTDAANPEHHFGTVTEGLRPKAAYSSLCRVSKIVAEARRRDSAAPRPLLRDH